MHRVQTVQYQSSLWNSVLGYWYGTPAPYRMQTATEAGLHTNTDFVRPHDTCTKPTESACTNTSPKERTRLNRLRPSTISPGRVRYGRRVDGSSKHRQLLGASQPRLLPLSAFWLHAQHLSICLLLPVVAACWLFRAHFGLVP